MFSRRLHPTPSGFAVGLAVIALWALIWIWFFAQLSGPRLPDRRVEVAAGAARMSLAHARNDRGGTSLQRGTRD